MSTFDLESYIGQYKDGSYLKIQRLLCISENNENLALEAANLALSEIQKGRNSTLYKETCEKLKARGLPIPLQVDSAWICAVDEKSNKDLEKLENEIAHAKHNLVKEVVRRGHMDLGMFYRERGQSDLAVRSFLKTRESCTTQKHHLEMYLNATTVSIESGNLAMINNYLGKAEQHLDEGDKDLGKVRIAAAVSLLQEKKYKMAAKKLLDVPQDLGNEYNEVFAAYDVALIAGVCALATFERSELKSKVLDNNHYRTYLELIPELREIINDFYESKYTTCLSGLTRLAANANCDFFLRTHWATLEANIREKSLRQYVQPFLSVDLKRMSEAFNTSVIQLEKELVDLIMNTGLMARIDSHNKVLYSRRDNQRLQTYEHCLATGREFISDCEGAIRRMNMIKSSFEVRHLGRDRPLHVKEREWRERELWEMGR